MCNPVRAAVRVARRSLAGVQGQVPGQTPGKTFRADRGDAMNRTEPWASRQAPAIYRIYVDGDIRPARLNRQIAMKMDLERDRRGQPVTKLTGVLSNQAQLIGVLMALYEMGYTLMSLERVGEPEPG